VTRAGCVHAHGDSRRRPRDSRHRRGHHRDR